MPNSAERSGVADPPALVARSKEAAAEIGVQAQAPEVRFPAEALEVQDPEGERAPQVFRLRSRDSTRVRHKERGDFFIAAAAVIGGYTLRALTTVGVFHMQPETNNHTDNLAVWSYILMLAATLGVWILCLAQGATLRPEKLKNSTTDLAKFLGAVALSATACSLFIIAATLAYDMVPASVVVVIFTALPYPLLALSHVFFDLDRGTITPAQVGGMVAVIVGVVVAARPWAAFTQAGAGLGVGLALSLAAAVLFSIFSIVENAIMKVYEDDVDVIDYTLLLWTGIQLVSSAVFAVYVAIRGPGAIDITWPSGHDLTTVIILLVVRLIACGIAEVAWVALVKMTNGVTGAMARSPIPLSVLAISTIMGFIPILRDTFGIELDFSEFAIEITGQLVVLGGSMLYFYNSLEEAEDDDSTGSSSEQA